MPPAVGSPKRKRLRLARPVNTQIRRRLFEQMLELEAECSEDVETDDGDDIGEFSDDDSIVVGDDDSISEASPDLLDRLERRATAMAQGAMDPDDFSECGASE